MKKYISLFLCAAFTFAACQGVKPDKIVPTEEYAGSRASVELSTTDPIPAEGGTLKATVHRSPAFEASLPKTADWISVSQADSVLTLTVRANPSAVLRHAHVSIIDKELKISVTSFDVVQAGNEKEEEPVVYKSFSVSPEAIAVGAKETSATIFVTADDVPWTITSSNPAFTADPSSGTGNATVIVSFPANTAKEPVSAVITVSTTSEEVRNQSFAVTITQEAGSDEVPAVKPAPGTVLAEWEFDTPQAEALRAGGFESVPNDADAAQGNVGDAYVPSNVSGKGKLEYFNGTDKSSVSTKKNKRRIGERGEPCIYCSWEGDYFVWTAEPDAPLAAGTKIQVNFALRPSHEDTPKYWKCEMLDGDKWIELETISLDFHKDAAGTAEDPKQINCLVKQAGTLTADTPYAQFRFTCSSNARCYDGAPIEALTSKYVLRFAGKWSDASDEQKYLQVPENPKIMVVE